MWGRADNQEVGSEAATLERVRNSSLVQWPRAENVPGLKPTAEAADFARERGVVGERRHRRRSPSVSAGGGVASANAGMSSVKAR
jgi:hypothetical protein